MAYQELSVGFQKAAVTRSGLVGESSLDPHIFDTIATPFTSRLLNGSFKRLANDNRLSNFVNLVFL